MKAVAYMLDTSIWKTFVNTDVADYAIGGPTVELLFNSYNQTHQTQYKAKAKSEIGYQVSCDNGSTWSQSTSKNLEKEKPYVVSDTTKANGMWLASPHSNYETIGTGLMEVGCGGSVFTDFCHDIQDSSWEKFGKYVGEGFRPVICLKSNFNLKKSVGGSSYTITEEAVSSGNEDQGGGSGNTGDSEDDEMQGDDPTPSQGVSAKDIANAEDKKDLYGKEVNYIVEGVEGVKWKIFYSDEENIYLIADDYIERSLFPVTKQSHKPNDGTCQRDAYFTDVLTDYQRFCRYNR